MSGEDTEGRLPPGQLATRKFPSIGERDPEPFDPASWSLVVAGEVERER